MREEAMTRSTSDARLALPYFAAYLTYLFWHQESIGSRLWRCLSLWCCWCNNANGGSRVFSCRLV
jgi:hypothetical protein